MATPISLPSSPQWSRISDADLDIDLHTFPTFDYHPIDGDDEDSMSAILSAYDFEWNGAFGALDGAGVGGGVGDDDEGDVTQAVQERARETQTRAERDAGSMVQAETDGPSPPVHAHLSHEHEHPSPAFPTVQPQPQPQPQPGKRVPSPLAFPPPPTSPGGTFYIDPLLCLPTPVDDTFPHLRPYSLTHAHTHAHASSLLGMPGGPESVWPGVPDVPRAYTGLAYMGRMDPGQGEGGNEERGAYTPPPSALDPRLSLLTPVDDVPPVLPAPSKEVSSDAALDPALPAHLLSAPAMSRGASHASSASFSSASTASAGYPTLQEFMFPRPASDPIPMPTFPSSHPHPRLQLALPRPFHLTLPPRTTPTPSYLTPPPTTTSHLPITPSAAAAAPALPAGFPTRLPLSFPARTGVGVLNAKSVAVGWDCGPATVSLFEALYGYGGSGGGGGDAGGGGKWWKRSSRDVQPDVLGGLAKVSVNWRLYGDGRVAAGAGKLEQADYLAGQGRAPARRIVSRKRSALHQELKADTPNSQSQSQSQAQALVGAILLAGSAGGTAPPSAPNATVPAQQQPTADEARAIWMCYYAELERFRATYPSGPSVLGPCEPEWSCPMGEGEGR